MTIKVTDKDLADLNRVICAAYANGSLSEQLFRGWMHDYLEWSGDASYRSPHIWFEREKAEESAPAVRLEPASPPSYKDPDDDIPF